jgi:hypothetical protein
MKHSRLLSTSILIALGLLLAIVKSASAQQNKPLPSSPNRQTTPQNDDQVRKRGEPEIPNPSFQAQAKSAPTNFIVMLKPDSVKNREGGAICYGIIRYRDVFGDFYTLTFGYQMLFSQINDDSPVMQGKFFLGPDEYNREPQKEK